MQKIKVDDLLEYRFLSGIAVSPSGRKAAYVMKQADKEQDTYKSWLWLLDLVTGKNRQITFCGQESQVMFEDEDTILFRSVRGDTDKPKEFHEKTVYYRLSLKGGEASRAFELPFTVGSIKMVSKGRYVFEAVIDLNRPEDETEWKEYGDYHILEELPFWKNGAYFASGLRNSLFYYEEQTESCRRITQPLMAVSGYQITGSKVVYKGCEYDQMMASAQGLYEYDIDSGQTSVLQKQGELKIGLFACIDQSVYFAGSSMEPYGLGQYPDFYKTEGGRTTMIVPCGQSVGASLSGDTMLGSGERFLASEGTIFYAACVRTKSEIWRLNETEWKREMVFDGAVDSFDAVCGGLLIIGRRAGQLQELYFYDTDKKEYRQLTAVNQAVLEGKYIGIQEECSFTDSDGTEIDGWVILPKDYDSKQRYGAILDIHGGPRAAYGDVFFHELQWFANEGYFVLICNPRGSDGRGDEFSDLRKRYGTIDYRDLMEFTDHVLEKYPAIDAKRLGVTGGSYGGFMTNWIIGHTDRFAAAVSLRSLCNWISDFGGSEIGYSFDVNENDGSTPWTDVKGLWERSPLAYADRAKTPTLFIHSIKDYNCPLSEGLQMFAALKYHGVPSKAFLIEGENHELSRSGKPSHRIRRLTEMKAWFDRYLKQNEDESEQIGC